MSAPFRCQRSTRVGAGTPPQTPSATLTGLPIRPVPDRVGAERTEGTEPARATVTPNVIAAEPPEFDAVTVTGAASRAAETGMLTRPVAGSTPAPAPVTLKVSAAPAKPPAVSISRVPLARSKLRSASPPATTGGAWVILTGTVAAASVPARFEAVTTQRRSAMSSAGTGV